MPGGSYKGPFISASNEGITRLRCLDKAQDPAKIMEVEVYCLRCLVVHVRDFRRRELRIPSPSSRLHAVAEITV